MTDINNDPYESAKVQEDPYEDAKVGKIRPAQNILQRVAGAISKMNSPVSDTMGPFGAFAQGVKREVFNINPSKNVGEYAKDYFTDPDQMAKSVVALGEGGNILEKGVSKTNKFIDFGGKKSAQSVAESVGKSLEDVKGQFDSRYKPIIKKKVENFGLSDSKEIGNSAREASVASPNPDVFIKLADDLEGMSPEQLHNIKQKIWKIPGGQEVYNKINEVLKRPGVFGEEYGKLTDDMAKYINEEKNYVSKLFRDSEKKPSGGKIKSKTDLEFNQETALKKFGERTGNPFLDSVKAIKRGQKVKSAAKRVAPFALGYGAYDVMH